MRLELDNGESEKTQRTYARTAGCLFLGVIVLALSSGLILSHIAGDGTFAETSIRIVASEHLYRAALAAAVIATLGSALLAFALYATLKPVNSLLAQLAMIFSLGDSFLALVVRMCAFVKVHLYTSAQPVGAEAAASQTLVGLMGNIAGTTENIGGIAFGIGAFLYFYLFFESRYIPRALSALGLLASALWIGLYFASLVFPEHHGLFQIICFPPMLMADIVAGFYLMLFAVKTEGSGHPPVRRTTS